MQTIGLQSIGICTLISMKQRHMHCMNIYIYQEWGYVSILLLLLDRLNPFCQDIFFLNSVPLLVQTIIK